MIRPPLEVAELIRDCRDAFLDRYGNMLSFDGINGSWHLFWDRLSRAGKIVDAGDDRVLGHERVGRHRGEHGERTTGLMASYVPFIRLIIAGKVQAVPSEPLGTRPRSPGRMLRAGTGRSDLA
jgi:hypothetical protein